MHEPPAEQTVTKQPSSPAVRRMPGLEALRCVAALCVLLLHTRAVYGGVPVFGRGYLGVDFFLMLSGYLMARIQEPRLAAGMNGWRFLLARYRRLWPLMALGGLIGLPMQYVSAHGLREFFTLSALNLALLPDIGQYFAFPLNIPAWTIFAELVVNAAHVLVLRRLRTPLLWPAIALGLAGMLWLAHGYGSLDLGAKPVTLLPGLARCLFAYMVGMALARWWRDEPPPVPPLLAFAAMPAALVACWALHLAFWWLDVAFVLIICPLMLAGGIRLRRCARLADFAGKLGFPLFAWQMPILQGLRALGGTYWLGFAGGMAGGIAGIFVEGWLTRRRNRNKTPAIKT